MMTIYYPNPTLRPSRLMLALGHYVAALAAAGLLAWRASINLPQDSRFNLVMLAVCVAWPAAIFLLISTLDTTREAYGSLRLMWLGVVERFRADAPRSGTWTVVKLLSDLALGAVIVFAMHERYTLAIVAVGVACTLAPVWLLVRGDGGMLWRITMAIVAVGMMASLVQFAIGSLQPLPLHNRLALLVTGVILTWASFWWIERAFISDGPESVEARNE